MVISMSKVYTLGTGCSRNYSQSTANINGLLSPLDADVFRTTKNEILAKGVNEYATTRT